MLAGQPELRELLKYATFAAVRQRIRISFHMLPMTLPETCTYIDHHTARCGRPTSIFADDAKADIHRHAGGLPRLVNALCYRSILHAAASTVTHRGAKQVAEIGAFGRLCWPMSASATDSPLVRRLLARIEQAVTAPLPPAGLTLDGARALAAEIEAPARDLLALGGKRWRPLLLALSCEMCEGPEGPAIALAPVVELAHNGSLIIDDIEDGADLRRGAPAAHLRHGLDLAINAGNLLYFLPAGYLAAAGLDTAIELQVHRLYGAAMLRLHYGQGLDILWHRDPERIPALPEYFAMCRGKSGSLAGLAAALGATAARAPAAVVALLGAAGEEFGVCFQIIDDVRNLTTGNPGKRRGDDLIEGKKSLPVILYCNRDAAARRRMVALLAACSAADVGAGADVVEEAIALMHGAGVIEEARTTAKRQYARVVERLDAQPGLAAGPAWEALRDLTGALIG